MARKRYRSGIGSKILIWSVFLVLFVAVAALVLTVVQNGRFNNFKTELSGISGEVKSKISAEYQGEIYETTKKDFSRIYSFLTGGRRMDSPNGAKITDTVTIRFNAIGREGELTISQTDTEYYEVHYESDDSTYAYWFNCTVGFKTILKLAGVPAE